MGRKHVFVVGGTKLTIAFLLLYSVVITLMQSHRFMTSWSKGKGHADVSDVVNDPPGDVEKRAISRAARYLTKTISSRREEPVSSRTRLRPLSCQNCFRSDFPTLMGNSSVCRTGSGVKPVDVIMMIFTTHTATERRQAIRDTWASVTRRNTANTRHVFVLGRSLDPTHMRNAEEEHTRHGDLLVLDFVDSYRNLTLKTMSSLNWIVNNCGRAR